MSYILLKGGAQSSKLKAQGSKPKAQSSKLKAQRSQFKAHSPKRRGTTGFTLIEMLVVITIVGIIGSIAIVSMRGVILRNDFRRAVTTLAADLERIQSIAASRKHVTRIVRENNGYRLVDETDPASSVNIIRKFPNSVIWSSSDEFAPTGSEIIFFRSHTPYSDSDTLLTGADDELVVENSYGDTRTVRVRPVTGMVEVL